MTTNLEAPLERRFVSALLPWVLAAAGLVFFALTLSHWITASSLPALGRVAGYQWSPVLSNPVYYLVTLPLKLLPASWLPLCLNLLSAICAAAVLGLLARCAALLPHDRTHPQRLLEKDEYSLLSIRLAWFPVVFAVLICACQLTFWERATSGSPDMLSVLLFAYAVRGLLEYRLDGRESWLLKAGFAYALGITENWLFILLFPGFMVSVVWFMGFSFFNLRFLSRLWLVGLAGVSLCFVLPAVAAFNPDFPLPFWAALKLVLGQQKTAMVGHWQAARIELALAALPSLLPMFIIGLKFGSYFGDTSRIGIGLAKFCFHTLHAGLLLFCTWVVLDPPFSARQRGLGAEFLPLHFLAALGAAYFSGYFLLLFGERARVAGIHRDIIRKFNFTVVALVWLFALATVATLLHRNLPVIRAADGRILHACAAYLTQDLPPQPAVLLSDDPRRLWLVQAALARKPGSPKHLPVDTRLLTVPNYHRTLHRQSGGFWPSLPTNCPPTVEHVRLIDLVLRQAAQREVCYLHPSFGYYFEFLHAIPSGFTYKLATYGTNDVVPPALSADVIERNTRFWEGIAADALPRLARWMPQVEPAKPTNFIQRYYAFARVKPPISPDAQMLASFLSRAANTWGVQLQQLGRMKEAGESFRLAEELNPGNVVAGINREFNLKLVAGEKGTVSPTRSIEDRFGAARSWDQVIGENGPFDEPTACYEQGRTFALTSLYRQAMQQFERVRTLAPSDVPARLWLGNLYLLAKLYDRTLDIAQEVRNQPQRFALSTTNRLEFMSLEASAQLGKGDVAGAERLIYSAISRDPTNYLLLASSASVYLRTGQLTNAVKLLDRQLALQPRDPEALMNKGYAYLQMGAFAQAIPPLTQVLSLQPSNHIALLNRAIASLQDGQLDAAQADYQALYHQYTNVYQVHFGLGEVAWRRHATNDAINYYTLYLSNAPPNSTESKIVAERLRQLKPASP